MRDEFNFESETYYESFGEWTPELESFDLEFNPTQFAWGEMELETPAAKKPPAKKRAASVGTDCGRAGSPAATVSQPGGRCTGATPPTCPLVPGILSVQSVSNIPFEYVAAVGKDPATKLTVVTQRLRPRTQRFLPSVQTALTQFVANMSRFGMPIAALLTAGSYCCRCVSKTNSLSNHSHGDAFDLVGVRWASPDGRETIVHNWNNSAERLLLRRINACMRLSFATVIDYHRADHRDHFHGDTNRGRDRDTRSRDTLRFTQEALSIVLNRSIPVTGNFDAATQRGLVEFAGGNKDVLKNAALLDQTLTQLFTRIASTPVNAAPPGGGGGVMQEAEWGITIPRLKAPAPSPVARVSPCEDSAKNPPGLTLCEKIPLGSESPAQALTGIYIPAGYKLQRNVDLLIYLHGHKEPSGVSTSATIADIWKRPEFRLREALNDSGKEIILVAPTLGPTSRAGKLADEKFGLDWYADQIMKVLIARGPYKGVSHQLYVGSIILACHSGGGVPMRQLAQMANHRYAKNIIELWGFDCLYNSADPALWRKIMKDRNAELSIHFLRSTAVNSLNLAGKGKPPIQPPPNIKVERSRAKDHGLVPITHWKEKLQQAPLLRDK